MLRRFSSYAELATELSKVAADGHIRTISFDVFDTLVHRRLAPQLVLDGVCHVFRDLLLEHGLPLPQRPLLRYRHDAYVMLTRPHVGDGLDPDTTLEELAPAWVAAATGLDAGEIVVQTIARRLVDVETDIERRVCFANPWLVEVLPALRQQNIKIYGISDMYLGARHVGAILADHGLRSWLDDLVVSGDHRRLKRTGRLFEHVRDSHGIAPEHWLHVGDNLEADGLMARRHGIRAWIINDRLLHQQARMQDFDASAYARIPRWVGNIVASYAHAVDATAITDEQMYGRRIVGPILTTFVHRVLERCREEKIGRVFFLAREGHLLKKIYRQLAPLVFPAGDAPPAIYLAVSRLTALLGAMQRFGPRELAAAMANTGHYSLRNLLAPLQLEAARLEHLARRNGINDIDAALPHPVPEHPSLLRLLEDPELVQGSEDMGRDARERLHTYLRQSGWFDQEKVAVVDLGWGGQIQDSLHHSMSELPQRPAIVGLYLGTNSQATLRHQPNSRMEGLLADERSPHWSASAAFEFVFALEAACRAPHGTTVGYRAETDGTIIPIFKSDVEASRQAEKADEGFIALLQRGVLDYAELYAECAGILRLRGTDMLPYAQTLIERMIRYPTIEEIKWWSRLNNVADLGSSNTKSLGHTAITPSLTALKAALGTSAFHYGLAGLTTGLAGQMGLSIARGLRRRATPHSIPTACSNSSGDDNSSPPGSSVTVREANWERAIDAELERLWTMAQGHPCIDARRRLGELGVWELAPIAFSHWFARITALAVGKRLPPRGIPTWWHMVWRYMHARGNLANRLGLVQRLVSRMLS